jgi:hypothetical protein
MTEMWHIWLKDGGFKKEIHLCKKCGYKYNLYIKGDPLIVIATNNGKKYLEKLLPTVKYPFVLIDTGSTEPESIKYFNDLDCIKARIKGGYAVGAYEYAYRKFKADNYFFMQDSMMIKKEDFIEDFENKGSVVAWLRFFYAPEHGIDYLNKIPGDSVPEYAIFGPIFYATKEAMDTLNEKGLFPPIPVNKDEAIASESGYGLAFHRAGIEVSHVEEMDNQRIDETRDYKMFDKFRPHRA